MVNNIKKQIDFLTKQLRQWEYEYYGLEKPTVSDAEYDLTLRQLIDLEKQYPQYVNDNSPTKRVGGYVSKSFEKTQHEIPMLSLNNAFNEEELRKFDNDVKEAINLHGDVEYNLEPKIDGLSISLTYIDGKLVKALTRGDGEIGENVIENIRTIKSIPLVINTQLPKIEIRGEVFLSFKEFERINNELKSEEKFANPRNAAAGSLRNLDSSLTAKRKLQMIAYYIPDESILTTLKITKQSDVISQLKSFGFKTARECKKCTSIDDAINEIKHIQDHKENLEYPIDGIVLKVNDINTYDDISRTSKFPKWAIAYKFPPEIKQTKLIDIIATVGRSGKITYVAKLIPTTIGGSVVSSATLHNADYIINNDIRINDIVKIFKAGEIIPKVIGPILNKRPTDTIKFVPITNCPICHTILEKQDNEVDQYCTNVSCPSRIVQSLIHFCSRNAMNIEDLSERNLQKLFDAKIIQNISDIYLLDKYRDTVLQGEFKIKDKSFNNIWNNIIKSKNNSLERLIIGLGIRHVGETTAKVLAKTFRTLDRLINSSLDELLKINDVGEMVAISIVDYFKNSENMKLINTLKDLGVNMSYLSQVDESQINKNSPYYQKSFVITGSFDIARHEIKKILETKYDAIVNDAITKNTNYLIVGENGGSKIEKANKLGIKIIKDKIWS